MINNNLQSMNLKEFPLGAVIVQEGVSSPKVMVIVLKGNVGVYKNYKLSSEVFKKVIGPGSFHGEHSLFLNHEQTESLVALTSVVVLLVNKKNVNEFFSSHTDMALTIVENICERLAKTTAILEKQQQESKTAVASGISKLFPEKHGSYVLPLSNSNEELIYCIKVTCPLCKHTFDNLGTMMSRLKRSSSDVDMRIRYKDAEPLYYEIVTCPNCFFSADYHSFPDVSGKFSDDVNQKVGPYKLEICIQTGRDRDTFSVFSGYYLALLCAPIIFSDYQLIIANLWLKISRLYNDCKDIEMEKYASRQALENYQYAYSNLRISEKQYQQVCYLIGELNCKLGDLEAAKNFLYIVKRHPSATDVMKRQADKRIDEIRELAKANAE